MALKYISKLKEKEGKMHGIIQIHNHFKQSTKIKVHPNLQSAGVF